jgi:signal transduction histidine kinase
MRGHGHRHGFFAHPRSLLGQHGVGFLAYYVRASLHRRIFFLIGASLVVNACIAGTMGHFIGVDASHRARGWALLGFFVLMLWAVSGKIARRLTSPFVELARVAQEIGRGNLGARFVMSRRGRSGEAFLIGASINEMAGRIEKQLKDQRELLAAVSHEVRTPLARIRMLVELARSRAHEGSDAFVVGPKTLDDLDREVIEIDALVGDLLASSRLDFAAIAKSELDACDVVRRALERQALSPTVSLPDTQLSFRGDPTLVQRALANLLQNAVVHGGGVDALVVSAPGDSVRFEVNDRGPGLTEGEETKVFESFYRGAAGAASSAGDTHAALGLGLSLVKRIAVAHGGRVFAENREGGGARIGFELPREMVPTEG